MPGAPDTRSSDTAPPSERTSRTEIKHPLDKARIRFCKSGSLRLLSHHDLMRTFERLLRRSELPFHRSQGFHPKPRLVFALSLPLGVLGREEVVELELAQVLSPEEIHVRLSRQAPPGLEILSVRRIPINVNAQVSRLTYALPVPAERLPDLSRRIADVLVAPACWIDRHRPNSSKPDCRFDIRPILVDLLIHPPRGLSDSAMLEMILRLTPTGTARPEELLSLLELKDLLDAGAVLERSRLELHDELPSLPHIAPGLPGAQCPPGKPGAISLDDDGPKLEKESHEKRDAY